jgi:hypothetical protein
MSRPKGVSTGLLNKSYEPSSASNICISSIRQASLVQSLQESIQAKLRPFLEKPGVTDEELMERVNVAVSAETERQNKMAGVKKVVKLIKW